MYFKEWLAGHECTLQPWAQQAADAFFKVMHDHRTGATGKSFLMFTLYEYACKGKDMPFGQWLKERRITLNPWQQEAADAFFSVPRVPVGNIGMMPTYIFLVGKMSNFVKRYGNDFEIGENHLREAV